MKYLKTVITNNKILKTEYKKEKYKQKEIKLKNKEFKQQFKIISNLNLKLNNLNLFPWFNINKIILNSIKNKLTISRNKIVSF